MITRKTTCRVDYQVLISGDAIRAKKKAIAPVAAVPTKAGIVLLALLAFAPSWALYDASKEYIESPAVAARYPDPAVDIATPGLRAGRTDFTSQQELEAFIQNLAGRATDLRVRVLGRSQEGRDIHL